MIQETIATGRDVNAAIDNGCLELGIDREEDLFDFEIIAREKKGFLGLKTYPAKVRVFREVPDPKPAPVEKPKAPAPAPKAAAPKAPAPEKKPREEKPAAPAQPKEAREPKEQPKREPRPPKERKPREDRPRQESRPRPERPERPAPEPPAPRQPAAPRVEVEPTDNVRARVERSAALPICLRGGDSGHHGHRRRKGEPQVLRG